MGIVLRCLVEEISAVCQVVFCAACCCGERWFDAFGVGHLQCSIHLIGRDVIEAFAFVFLRQTFPIEFSCLQEGECSHYVCACKGEWVFDGTIHVTLCCEVNNAVNLLVLHEFVEGIEVADVHLYELIVGLVFYVFQVGEVAGIGQLIEVDDVVLWVLVYEETYHMTADKTGAASYDNAMFHNYTLYSNGLSKSLRFGCLVSFSLRMAFSVGICQSMPRLSSVMEMPPSASGW